MRLCRMRVLTCWVLMSLGSAAGMAVAQTPAVQQPDLNRGQAIAAQTCAACHGVDGNSATGAYPKLAGQHVAYLEKQLHDFKTQPGAKGPARSNPIMLGFASSLSDADIVNVSAYFAGQQEKPGFARDKDTVALGQQIFRGGIADKAVPACAGCHGPTGAGIPTEYPRLGGQWQDYTAAQLTAFQTGTRTNSQPMHDIALRLSDAEVKAVADYIAGLR